MKRIIVILSGIVFFQSCTTESEPIKVKESVKIDVIEETQEVLPETFNPIFKALDSLSSFKKTNFSPTLEGRVKKGDNLIYAATMLFAWDEFRKEIKDSIIDIESEELRLINNSKSFKGVLTENEYETSVEIIEDTIIVRSSFKKSLPFSYPLTKFESPLLFKGDSVESFGFYGENFKSSINYYKTDDNFSISLLPKDNKHEIILIKLLSTESKSLKEVFEKYNTEKQNFIEHKTPDVDWKYGYQHRDYVKIPKLNFNIESNFETIENSSFTTSKSIYKILTFYQKNAFILNEEGVKVESDAIVESVTESAGEIGVEVPQPKYMVFDTDFVIFLKRKDAEFPYFGVYIANDELMIKFDEMGSH